VAPLQLIISNIGRKSVPAVKDVDDTIEAAQPGLLFRDLPGEGSVGEPVIQYTARIRPGCTLFDEGEAIVEDM